jgi:hypothetical protein
MLEKVGFTSAMTVNGSGRMTTMFATILNPSNYMLVSFIWLLVWGILWQSKGIYNTPIKITFWFLALYGLLMWLHTNGYIVRI